MLKISESLIEIGADGYRSLCESKLPPDVSDFEIAQSVLMPVLDHIQQDILLEHKAGNHEFNSGLFLALSIVLGEHFEDCMVGNIRVKSQPPLERPRSPLGASETTRLDLTTTVLLKPVKSRFRRG